MGEQEHKPGSTCKTAHPSVLRNKNPAVLTEQEWVEIEEGLPACNVCNGLAHLSGAQLEIMIPYLRILELEVQVRALRGQPAMAQSEIAEDGGDEGEQEERAEVNEEDEDEGGEEALEEWTDDDWSLVAVALSVEEKTEQEEEEEVGPSSRKRKCSVPERLNPNPGRMRGQGKREGRRT